MMKNKENHSHLGLLNLKGEGAYGDFSKLLPKAPLKGEML